MGLIGLSFDGEVETLSRGTLCRAFVPQGTLQEVLDYYGTVILYTDTDCDDEYITNVQQNVHLATKSTN